MFDVITIGGATADIFVKSDSLVVKQDKDFNTGLSISLAHSSKNEVSQSLICSGGGATNTAVSFSRLGLKPTCLSLLGNDPLGEYVFQELGKNRVDTSFLIHPRGEKTDYSIVLVAPDGGRAILINRGETHLEEKHITWENLNQTKWFYISSLEGNIDLLEKLIGFAKENNIKVALNPGNRELSQKNRLLPLIKHIEFLLLNRTESENLLQLDIDNSSFWTKLKSLGANIAAVTNGREGAHVLTVDGQNLYSPIINTTPVDETGAGDAFGSTFVAALIHQKTIEESLFWGIKNSASVVSFMGAKTGLLTVDKIEEIKIYASQTRKN